MPRGLTLRQRLVGPEGLPTGTAKATLCVLAAAGAAAGFVARGDADPRAGSQPEAAISVSRLAGEGPGAEQPSAPRLTRTARLPASPSPSRPRRSRARSPQPASPPAASATPAPAAAASPEPTATATPAPAAPVTPVAAPDPAPAPAPPAAPRRPRPSGPSFDSSG